MVLWEFAWKSASRIDVKSTKTTTYTCALASTVRNPKEPFITNMQALGESRVGGNELTPTGRQMKAVMEELDRQDRGM